MDLVDELVGLTSALIKADVDFAVCGGLAMAAHGLIRATEDIDILIQQKDLKEACDTAETCGFTVPGGEIPLKPGTSQEGMIFRVSKVIGTELLPLDIMLVTSAYESVWSRRTLAKINSTEIPVVSREGMIVMKTLAGRSKDLSDLEFLRNADEEN